MSGLNAKPLVWQPFAPTVPTITQVEHGYSDRDQKGSQWNTHLLNTVADNLGIAQANDRRNENIPWEMSFRAKKLPRPIILEWTDRNFDGGATLTNTFNQLNQFGWNLPENVDGYDTLTLFSVDLNMAWFTGFGNALNISIALNNIDNIGAGAITSKDASSGAKLVSPTFFVQNAHGAATYAVNNTSNMGAPQPINSIWAASIRGKSFGSLLFKIGDETLKPFTYIGAPPGTAYFFNVTMLLQ